MDPKLAYWTAAFVNMTVLAGTALAGVRYAKRGEVARHRRAMTIAAALVLAFLASYPLKLLFLGREDMSSWSALTVSLLRVHELCVLVMLVAGTTAIARGRRLARALEDRAGASAATTATASAATIETASAATLALRAAHRRAGRIALSAAVLGWLFAGAVLLGMYSHA